MTKIDIFSGFLGAGKTTLIRKLIAEGYKGEKLVLIENEFGDIAIDGGFLKDAGVEITEMNSGCICCTLVGDFTQALKKVMEDFSPDRIIIEPSGVGKLSDVAHAVGQVERAQLGCKLTVVDAGKCKMYMPNFGEFFNDQVSNADLLVMSRTDSVPQAKIMLSAELLRHLNPKAGLISTPWEQLSGEQIVEAMEKNGLKHELEEMEHEHHHHHHHHEHDENCTCGCHDHEHHHEHHHEHEHEHHHHHEHDENCTCGCHDHEHHHHADEIFGSFGMETPARYSEAELGSILDSLSDEERFGTVLRAKGMLQNSEGGWLYFDYVPGEKEIRQGGAQVTGRFCVIGSALKEQALKELFNIG